MGGITVQELAILRALQQKLPEASQKHVRALLCIIGGETSYQSLEEIERKSLLKNGELKKIMQSFAKSKLVGKEGCLYIKPKSEKIAEII